MQLMELIALATTTFQETGVPTTGTYEELTLRIIINLAILITAAKILGEIFKKIKLPSALGELLAGIILGPYALGKYVIIYEQPLLGKFEGNNIVVDPFFIQLAQIGAIIILFTAGLEMTFAQLRKMGLFVFLSAMLDVILSFFGGYYPWLFLPGFLKIGPGSSYTEAIFVGAGLVATSVAISSRILEDLKMMATDEAKFLLNTAIMDDVMGIAVMAVAVSIAGGETVFGPSPDPARILAVDLLMWLGLVWLSSEVVPRFIDRSAALRAEEAVESFAVIVVFVFAALSTWLGLSPLIGAFAAGMAIAGSKLIVRVKDLARHLNLIFSPLFFSIIGAQANLSVIRLDTILIIVILSAIGMITKVLGVSVPAYFYFKERTSEIKRAKESTEDVEEKRRLEEVLLRARKRNWMKALSIGYGMIPRGEVGLLVAGIGISLNVISEVAYAVIVGTVIITTIVTPLLLTRSLRKVELEMGKGAEEVLQT